MNTMISRSPSFTRGLLSGLGIVLVIAVLSGPAIARGDWWMFGHDPEHTRRSPFVGPQVARVLWTASTGGNVQSSAALGSDGTIYVGSTDGKLYAFHPDGTPNGAPYPTDGDIYSSPAIAEDGTIYVGSVDGYLYALNPPSPDITRKWRAPTGGPVVSSPAVGSDGTVYVGSNDGSLYAFDPADGSEFWRYSTGDYIGWSSPALGPDGTIYIGSMDDYLYAIKSNGTFKWRFPLRGDVQHSASVAPDGTVYIGSCGDDFYALDPDDGSSIWSQGMPGDVDSSPALGRDGTIYVLCDVGINRPGYLYAFNPDGSLHWPDLMPLDDVAEDTAPAIGSDGLIYFGLDNGLIYAVEDRGSEGRVKWSLRTGASEPGVRNSPSIGPDGTLYVGSYDNRLYAIKAGFQPDLLIRNAGEGEADYISDDVYNVDGTDQTKTQTVTNSTPAVYELKVQNDGAVDDSFTVTGSPGGDGWTVTYYDALSGGTDITDQVTGAGWSVNDLAARASVEFRVEVTPDATVAGDAVKDVLVTATSVGDPTKKDLVKASTTVPTRQPDMLIRNVGETTYTGDNVYNSTGTNQTKVRTVANDATAKYLLKVQNDGTMTDRFTVTGTAGSSTWTVRYYDAVSGGNNITDQVTGTGWTTASLAPGAYKQFRVEVVPGSTVAGGTGKPVLVKAASMGDSTKKDGVKASTTVALRYRPDLLIRNPGEATYTGDNVYNTTGANQTKERTVASGVTAKYYLKVQNDGNRTDSFLHTGTKGGSQWTVKYYDALSGGNDITDQMTGTGWTVSLAAGGTKQFRVEVTPGSGVASGTVKNVLVKATSTGDPTKKDAVKASTTVK